VLSDVLDMFAQPPHVVAAADGHDTGAVLAGQPPRLAHRQERGHLPEPAVAVDHRRGGAGPVQGGLGGRVEAAVADRGEVRREPAHPVRVVPYQVRLDERGGDGAGVRGCGARRDEDLLGDRDEGMRFDRAHDAALRSVGWNGVPWMIYVTLLTVDVRR
jgi:hypothetical protein